tara:strand:- start:68 stop:412 length:345 start_codon:yes stop_codon:yes gene_type:complete
MANTYEWRIQQLDAKIQDGDLQNVIYRVYWNYIATDDSVNPIIVNTSGSNQFIYNPDNPFIPYDQLTKEDVMGWLLPVLDVEAMKINLDSQIELLKNPIDEVLYPGWDSPMPPN